MYIIALIINVITIIIMSIFYYKMNKACQKIFQNINLNWDKFCHIQNEENEKIIYNLNHLHQEKSNIIREKTLIEFANELSSRIGDATTDVQGCRNLIKCVLGEYIRKEDDE